MSRSIQEEDNVMLFPQYSDVILFPQGDYKAP